MKNFLKLVVGVIIVITFAVLQNSANAQGFKPDKGSTQVNLGVNVVDVVHLYAGLDFAISEFITVGPRVAYGGETENIDGYEWKYTNLIISVRGDYHFSGHFKSFPSKLDLYAGPSIGYYFSNTIEDNPSVEIGGDKTMEYWFHIGTRWYFSEKFAANAEFNPGTLSPNGLLGGYITIGASIRF